MKIRRLMDLKNVFFIEDGSRVGLFSLAIPMLFENIMVFLQGIVNTLILSDISEVSVSASGSANTVINIFILFFSVFVNGATVIVSNYIGAGDKKKQRESVFSVLFIILVITLLFTPFLLILAPYLMRLLNLSGEIYVEAVIYFRIRMGFVSVTSIYTALLSLLRCFGFPKYTFIIGLAVNTINLLLNIAVVYFPSISPVDGIAGIAATCVAANFCGLLLSCIVFAGKGIGIAVPSFFNMLSQIRLMMKIGIPSGISSASFTFTQMLTTSFVALAGDQALTAKVYFATILQFSHLFSYNTGIACSLLVGRLYGFGDMKRSDKLCRATVCINLAVNLAVSVLIFLLRMPLLAIYTDDSTILQMSTAIFAVDIIAEIARAVSHVYDYALKAIRDVYLPLAVLVFSCLTLGLGLSYLLTVPAGLGLLGCYVGTTADELLRAAFTCFRWKRKAVLKNRI